MGFMDKLKKIMDIDFEDDFDDYDDFVAESYKEPLFPKAKDKTGISEKVQEKLVMNEDLSIKECIDILEHTTQKLKKSLGLDELEK